MTFRSPARALLLLSVAVLSAVSCGDNLDMSGQPTGTALSGSWTGTGRSRLANTPAFSVRATFVQNGSSVSGTWSTVSSNGPNSGSIAGTFSAGGLTAILTPSDPRTCDYSVTMTINNAKTRLDGAYATRNCTVADSGTIDLTKG
jgi:hypothetical protein